MTPGPSDPDNWRQVRDILAQALELNASERPGYLDGACNADPALRSEVESLLAASERSAFIDKSPDLLEETASLSSESLSIPAPQFTKLGHYKVIQKIGQGGMGAVYEAKDENLGRRVALKIIRLSDNSTMTRQRFRREARAASALNHPNIVTIYEFGNDNDIDFLAMEYVEGHTLRHYIVDEPAPLPQMLGYARQAALALGHAHSKSVVHRDLKPGNIMITPTGLVKVLDFGLAKLIEGSSADGIEGSTHPTPLTQPGSVLGTPAYMSPEQSLGEPTAAASDIFSFGVILFEMACGRRPFDSNHSMVTLQEIAFKRAPLLNEFNPQAPAALAALVDHCLNKAPADRPGSMGVIAAQLAAIQEDLERPAFTLSKKALWLIVLLVLTLLSATAWFWQRQPA